MEIKLDLRTDLAKVDVVPQGTFSQCQYSAPCAVGAMMTPEQREYLDSIDEDSSRIDYLLVRGIVIVPEDQQYDLKALQRAFDLDSGFVPLLDQLKEKYGA